MTVYKEVEPQRTIIGKLDFEGDLIGQLNDIAGKNNILLGKVEAIGAVKKARIGYYDQNTFEYQFMNIDEHLEITSLIGNISIRDDKPFVHAHINLADENGVAYGGHLAEGTIVFACEFIMTEYTGPEFVRALDEQTRLPLWKI
ncbi:MAG: DNA-binding protein [Sedimentisphaerales bacterium]|nr:DNA-binding protein [Sedimentisphaerales bacterium]